MLERHGTSQKSEEAKVSKVGKENEFVSGKLSAAFHVAVMLTLVAKSLNHENGRDATVRTSDCIFDLISEDTRVKESLEDPTIFSGAVFDKDIASVGIKYAFVKKKKRMKKLLLKNIEVVGGPSKLSKIRPIMKLRPITKIKLNSFKENITRWW